MCEHVCAGQFAELLGTTAGSHRPSRVDDHQLPRRALRASARARGRDYHRRGALRAPRAAARVGPRVRVASARGRSRRRRSTAVLAEVGPRTRLIALSHVSWMTGHVCGLRDQGEAHVPLLVDGAHRSVPFPVEFGASTSTRCRARSGCAARTPPARSRPRSRCRGGRAAHILVPRGARLGRIICAGGRRTAVRHRPAPRPVARRPGNRLADPPPIAVRRRASDHRALPQAHLRALRGRHGAGPGDARDVRAGRRCRRGRRRLHEAGVVVREVPETGWVRVSCGYWNTEEHLERLLAALA